MIVKEILERLRIALDVKTNKVLAEVLEIPYSTLNTWITRNSIPIETIVSKSICNGVSIDWLLGRTEEEIILLNDATTLFSNLLGEERTQILFLKGDDIFGEDIKWRKKVKLFAIKSEGNDEDYPWVLYSHYEIFYLFNKFGQEVARATTIRIVNISNDLEGELEQLNEDYEVMTADWSRLFSHRFFREDINNIGEMVFIERIWVDETLRGQGIGKWLIEQVIEQAKNDLFDDLVVGVLAFSKEEEYVDFLEQQRGLVSFYQKAFESVGSSILQNATKFTFQKDLLSDGGSVICWRVSN